MILPRTIQDTIKVTRSLGLQFLWVDALCIIQDDKDDRQTELSKMAQVFARALVTISAASATHSAQGFLQPRNVRQAYYATYELPYYHCWDGVEEQVQ